MVRLTDRPDMTLEDVYRGRKTTTMLITSFYVSLWPCQIMQ